MNEVFPSMLIHLLDFPSESCLNVDKPDVCIPHVVVKGSSEQPNLVQTV